MGEQFFTDDHYEMVGNHEKKGVLNLPTKGNISRSNDKEMNRDKSSQNQCALDFYEGKKG